MSANKRKRLRNNMICDDMRETKNIKGLQFGEGIASTPTGLLPACETVEMAETVASPIGHKAHNGHLTSGSLLARNTVWNLVGSGAPMAVAIFSIPVLIKELGTNRFGVLTLAWAVIGYAGLFDLGLGRALTQLVARKLGAGEDRDVPE